MAHHRWIKNNNGSIACDFTHKKVRYKFAPVPGGRFANKQDLAIASQIAGQIEIDVKLGRFEGLDKYKTKTNPMLSLSPQKPKNLKLAEVWNAYKLAKADKIAETTQKTTWRTTDKGVSAIPDISIDALNAHKIIGFLSAKYAPIVMRRICEDLHSACNLAIKRGLLTTNPLQNFKGELPLHTNQRKKTSFSGADAQIIINAFKRNDFLAEGSHYDHSYYTEFVEFLFFTGLRPQMAIALHWDDEQERNSGRVLVVTRGYSHGIVKGSKTNRSVVYPLYPQLANLFDRIPHRDPVRVFPSQTGGYINLQNFTRRYWQPVVKGLVKRGDLAEYLPTYHTRHTAANQLAKAGVPVSTIAALLDTSPEMLDRNYLDNAQLSQSLKIDTLY